MKDAYYFPHFSNARHDRKIRRLRKELGVEGYGIYFMLLEVLRDQEHFKYPIQDIDLLAEEFGTSEQKLRTVISNYNLFQVNESEDFFSIKFIEYLKPYLENKYQKRINGIKGNLIRHGYATKKELANATDAEIIELNENKELIPRIATAQRPLSDRKEKKRKERKESKVKEIKLEESKVDYTEIKEYWNNKKRLPLIKILSSKRKEKLKLRIEENSIDDFKLAIDKISESDFATGNNKRNWKADIDWLIANDTNIIKVLEGKYDNGGGKNASGIREENKFDGYDEYLGV